MNKKLWVLIVSLITILVLSACNGTVANTSIVDDESCGTKYALKDVTGQRCVTSAELNIFTDAAANALGGTSQGSEPAATPEPAAAAAPASGGILGGSSCSSVDLGQFVGDPYGLIAVLDVQEGKIPQGSPTFTFSTEVDLLFWTGAYVGHLPEGVIPKLVDGKTGVFCIPAGTTVTVNFVGAYMDLSKFNPNAQVVASTDLPSGCMNKEDLAVGLNQYHNDTEALVRWLDSQVNVEGAPHLDARIRPNPLAAATYANQKPVTMVFWVSDGAVKGEEGTDFVYLSRGSGIGVYLIATDHADINKAHTGLMVCEDGLHPDKDLNYWN